MVGEKGWERKGGREKAGKIGGRETAGEKGRKRKSGKLWRKSGGKKKKIASGYADGGPRHIPWL
jgi:hypothetical protein